MKNNLGNYTHQVDDPDKFLRFDLAEGQCWFEKEINQWLKSFDLKNIFYYPDEKINKVKNLLARWLRVRPENIILGNGSDELIEIIPKIFLKAQNEVLTIAPSFFRFSESSIRAKAKLKIIRLKERNGFQWDSLTTKKFLEAAANKKIKLIWLASPNNPTGIDIPKPILLEIIKLRKMVILDKVLNGFTKELREASQLIWENPNLIILSSFSKTFGLPGLRFGFAIGSTQTIKLIENWRLPFNVSGPSLFIVEKLLQSLLKGEIKVNEGLRFFKERLFLEQEITQLKNIKLATKSKTNFILLKPEKHFNLFKKLLKKGILVTDLNKTVGIENRNIVRVTVRDRQKSQALLKVLREIDKHLLTNIMPA